MINNTPATYHYEAWLPESGSKESRITIAGIEDANITVSYVDRPGFWYSIDVTHYTSGKRHSVDHITNPLFLPLRVHITSVTRVRNINIVLGTDATHNLYISGVNLNTIVILDNGAKISGSRLRFYGTGIFQFSMTENVNYTTEGMSVKIGDLFSNRESPELVVLDIDLPTGLNGHLSTPNATFINNDWPINYDDEWGTKSINEPLLNIEIFFSMRVWANLRL